MTLFLLERARRTASHLGRTALRVVMSRRRSSDSPPTERRIRSTLSSSTNGEAIHYEVYFVPSPSSLLSTTTSSSISPEDASTLTRSSFYVVNMSSSMEEGTGIRYGLEFSPVSSPLDGTTTAVLLPHKEAMNISRSPSMFHAHRAVCIGWLEEDALPEFEAILLDREHAGDALRMEASTRSYVMSVANRLEQAGICSNVDLTLRGHI